MWTTLFWGVVVLVIVVKALRSVKGGVKKIRGMYSTGGEWVILKRYLMLIVLVLRKLKRKGIGPPKAHDNDLIKENQRMEQLQILNKADPHAIDSVYFYGGDPDSGIRFIIRLARRHNRLSEFWCLVVLPDGRLLSHPNCPDTRETDVDPDTWAVQGCRISCEAAMQRWKIVYNGLMKVHEENVNSEKEPQYVHIHLNTTFRAVTNTFDAGKDLSGRLMADALAREAWSRQFFEHLEKNDNQTHLNQWGSFTGSLTIDREQPIVLSLQGYRDHSFGTREWTKYYRYVAFFGQLENGSSFSVGSVCMPGLLTHLRYGYYFTPYGRKCPITWHNINLWSMAEVGTPANKYQFKFRAMSKTFNVEMSVDKALEMYIGQSWETIIYERFCSFRVNGFKGIGVNEFCYRNISGYQGHRPRSVSHLAPVDITPKDQKSTVVPFKHPACTNPNLVGGKGAQLGQLSTLYTINVPPGFVVTTHAYQLFVKENADVKAAIQNLKRVAVTKPNDLKNVCESVSSLIVQDSAHILEVRDNVLSLAEEVFGNDWRQKRLAVRSSASGEDGSEASGAGQMETFLGIKGDEELLKHIIKCWASQFFYQAVEYRRQHGLPIDTIMAVVVQEMVPADVAGVLFTNDPISGDCSRMTINANFGLGESVVSGECEPDTYVISRFPDGSSKVHEMVTGSKKTRITMNDESGVATQNLEADDNTVSLSEDQIQQLCKIGVQIERHYGSSRDIEWAFAGGNLYIFQARPITSCELESEEELLHEFDSALSYNKEYVTSANIGEMMPMAVTPLTLSIFGDAINKCLQAAPVYDRRLDDFVRPMTFLTTATNHIFINIQRLGINSELHISSSKMDMIYLALMGRVVKEPNLNDIEYFVGRSPFIFRFIRFFTSTYIRNISTNKSRQWEKKFKEGYHVVERFTARDQFENIDSKIEDYFQCWHDTVMNTAKSATWSMVIMGILGNNSQWTSELFSQVAILLSTCEDVYSADVPSALAKLAKTLAESDEFDSFMEMTSEETVEWLESVDSGKAGEVYREFMERHGHRCVREAEFRETSWRRTPQKVIAVVRTMIEKKCYETKAKEVLDVDEAIAKLSIRLNSIEKWMLKHIVPRARRGVGLREWGKSISIVMVNIVKEGYLRLGKLMAKEGRLPDEDLVYFFTHEELTKMLRSSDESARFPKLIAKALRRRRILEKQMTMEYPEMNCGIPKPLNDSDLDIDCGSGDIRGEGMSVSVGVIKAHARVISSLKDAEEIQKGDILIVPYTDVGWTPYFPLIGGLVTEKGGLLSHGSVVAREYGLPCIVGCRKATSMFKTGDIVLLNATKGFIEKQ